MRALCMITVRAGRIDEVMSILAKKRKTRHLLAVTGRADVCVVLQGSIHQINAAVAGFKGIKHVESTETLLEVEVDMGW